MYPYNIGSGSIQIIGNSKKINMFGHDGHMGTQVPIGIGACFTSKKPTIVFMGDDQPQLLPTFRQAVKYQPEFMRVVLRKLVQNGFEVPDEALRASYNLYHGDMIDGGRGEILLRA